MRSLRENVTASICPKTGDLLLTVSLGKTNHLCKTETQKIAAATVQAYQWIERWMKTEEPRVIGLKVNA